MESPWLWLLLVVTIVLLFPLVFVGLWMWICSLLASLARWPALAAQYPARDPAAGKPIRGEVTAVGAVRDRHATILHVSPLGLHMLAWWPFKVRRAPVLVPWAAVRYVSRGSLPWAKTHLLDLGGITTLRVRDRGFQAIEPHLAPDEQSRARSASGR
jgi:hypothetical protein